MDTQEQPSKKDRQSSERWQGRTIEQFGYALNLILGLTVGALGYELSFLLNEEIVRYVWQNCLFVLSMLTLLLSVIVGLLCVVNRLRDFRTTAKIARKREDGASDIELQPLRALTYALGKRTWLLFWWQITFFGVGILLMVIALGGTVINAMIA